MSNSMLATHELHDGTATLANVLRALGFAGLLHAHAHATCTPRLRAAVAHLVGRLDAMPGCDTWAPSGAAGAAPTVLRSIAARWRVASRDPVGRPTRELVRYAHARHGHVRAACSTLRAHRCDVPATSDLEAAFDAGHAYGLVQRLRAS